MGTGTLWLLKTVQIQIKIYTVRILLTRSSFLLFTWCSGRASSSGAGGRGFDTRPWTLKKWLPSLALRFAGMALLIGWCQDKLTSSTGNLPRKRRDITEQLLKAA